MSFLLKILDGPNKGAEIALPEGVAVTLGKGDDCDIVLADATLPDAPVSLAAAPDGVTLDGAPLESLHVKTIGATSFAVGPDGAPWGELAWPEKESLKVEGSKVEGSSSEIVNGAPNLKPSTEGAASAPRRRSAGCLIPAAVILILLFLIAWFLLPRIRSGVSGTGDSLQSANLQPSNLQPSTLSSLADRFGLAVEESEAGATRVTGNFATRRERLAATAEFYAAQPGVDLDLSDDESLRTAAEDTLAMLSEADLRVAAATNRVLALSGTARDIRRTLEALAADLPKLRDVDVS
ncbi:MAG: hypothetical protein IJV65_06575, partial [Kiritimatiellae bacterium]|nr:hypothetical protein [Kiritimatiellia bacterium]